MGCAVYVPIISTIALLTIYFCIKQEYQYMQMGMQGIFLLMSSNTLYYYQTEFLSNSFGGIKFID